MKGWLANRRISHTWKAWEAKAGPFCLVFNEASLIGYEMNDEDKGHQNLPA